MRRALSKKFEAYIILLQIQTDLNIVGVHASGSLLSTERSKEAQDRRQM